MNAPFAWPGGKRNLIKTLLPRIPAHRIYVEVFSGSAKLLFAKPPSPAEVINDLNGDVTNFFRIIKHRAAELTELLEHEILHPERFREHRTTTTTDELTRALQFAYTTWYSYGAKGEHFAAGNLKEMLRGQHRRPIEAVRTLLTDVSARLRKVRIEQRDFADLITRFDSPETFFYLDPPYVDFGDNGRYESLTAARRTELFDLLAAAQGQFLMSFDNCAEVRSLATSRAFRIEEVQTTYHLGSTRASRTPVTEVFVSSNEPSRHPPVVMTSVDNTVTLKG